MIPLTPEEIDLAATAFKDDLMRECRRCVRRKDLSGALSAIAAEEYIDNFVYDLKRRADAPWRALKGLPPRARPRSMRLSSLANKAEA
jgi:hypothetical protein